MGEEKKLDVPGTPNDGTISKLQITQQQHEEHVMENASLHVGKRGDTPFVSIPAGEAAIGVSQFRYSLIGRLDLQKPIPNHVFIDIEGKIINQEIILHRVPKFYNHYNNIGYCIAECKVIQREFIGEQNQAPKNNKNPGIVKSKGKQDPLITEVPSKTEKNKKVQSTSLPNKHTYFAESTAGKEPKIFVKGFRISGYNSIIINNEEGANKGNIWILWKEGLQNPRKKGRKPPCCRAVAEFSDVINAAYLTESITSGITYTWCNGQKGLIRILSVRDRSLINDRWNAKFQNWKFVNGAAKCLRNLHNVLINYQLASGQMISIKKSKIFIGHIPHFRRNEVIDMFGFREGGFPETYLGIPLVQGRPQSLIKEGDAIIRNFIKTGDPTKRKGIMLHWEKLCKLVKEGGLGIRSLKEVNNEMQCKLNWIFMRREEPWAQMIYAKFHTKSGDRIKYHKSSSVWPGIKFAEPITKSFIGWIIGIAKRIDFWRDTWATSIPLREHIDLPNHLWKLCTTKVSDFINPDGWNFPTDISLALLGLSGFAWKLMNQILPTNDLIQRKGIQLVSICTHCGLTAESTNHLFFECNVVKVLWSWATSTFNIAFIAENDSWKQILDKSKVIQNRVLREVENSLKLSKHGMYDTVSELQIIKALFVDYKMGKAPEIKSCMWMLPNENEIKLCCDGSALGNPSPSGIGIVYRDWEGRVLGTFCKAVGITTNYMAEVNAIIDGVEKALWWLVCVVAWVFFSVQVGYCLLANVKKCTEVASLTSGATPKRGQTVAEAGTSSTVPPPPVVGCASGVGGSRGPQYWEKLWKHMQANSNTEIDQSEEDFESDVVLVSIAPATMLEWYT
ncbi:hypothetical protein GIB67_015371 [Kingdonia uniflora]|uniref:Reverse transcriptase zinc-binding domain-containing protein n=1 Tax=Kingdonia uniflora TaxID=39325 RepID=A0A7J7KYV9_9MAGN|nr:hypothetical protein GIB67_015371 [Kingdonia uniflora]